MKFLLDVHCHTISSGHAYSTVTENAAHAQAMGLTHIGMADHGPKMPGASHFYHFSNQRALPDEIHGVQVLKGVEVNILDTAGSVDLPDEQLVGMDFVIASLHRGVVPPGDKAFSTQAAIAVMNNPMVSILGHPADVFFPLDLQAVAEAAAHTYTIIEINEQSLIPGAFRYHGDDTLRALLQWCKMLRVPVLASSDAHYHTSVGQMDRAKALILDAGIDEQLVLNTDPARFLAAVKKKREVLASELPG